MVFTIITQSNGEQMMQRSWKSRLCHWNIARFSWRDTFFHSNCSPSKEGRSTVQPHLLL